MANKPTAQDAQLILQLCHVRQEAEMRKARHWWLADFWPESPEDYLQVEKARRTQEGNWLRQVISYWGMAASFVRHGTLSERIFLEPAFSGEMFVIFAKVRPFLKELRKRTLTPDLMRNIEEVIMGSKASRERLRQVAKQVARRKILARTTATQTRRSLARVSGRAARMQSTAVPSKCLPWQTVAVQSHINCHLAAHNRPPARAT